MNIKGLKLNKVLINLIAEKIDNISISSLKGIDTFVSFSWSGFNKTEFKNIINAFIYLQKEGVFEKIDNEQLFVFNYSTDVTEMDITTVVELFNDTIIVDIEEKTDYEDAGIYDKMDEQIQKRITNHIPQLFKKHKFIICGVVNNVFYKAVYINENKKYEYETIDEFKQFFLTLKGCTYVENYLYQTSNIASIAKVCEDIKQGVYSFYEDTNRVADTFKTKLENGKSVICYGNAGSGKTVIALKLFFENNNIKLLMLNSKLYFALNLGGRLYRENRTTYKTESFLNMIDENTISIVDESQRLSMEQMFQIIQKSKAAIFFGDHRQACFDGCTLQKGRDLVAMLKKNYSLDLYYRQLKKSRRYSDEVDQALSCLTCKGKINVEVKLPKDYQINIYYDERKFIDEYERMDGIKKIYVSFEDRELEKIKIADKVFKFAQFDYNRFSISDYSDEYVGHTYHAISFDVDHCFVCLRKTKIDTYRNMQIIFSERRIKNALEIDLFLNELNVLFTRGKKSLNIFVSDIESYLYLNSRINKIKNK